MRTGRRPLLLAFAAAVLLASAAAAAERAVAPEAGALAAAIAAAEPGDVLRLEPGVHEGPIALGRPIVLDGGGEAVVEGRGRGSVVTVTSGAARRSTRRSSISSALTPAVLNVRTARPPRAPRRSAASGTSVRSSPSATRPRRKTTHADASVSSIHTGASPSATSAPCGSSARRSADRGTGRSRRA